MHNIQTEGEKISVDRDGAEERNTETEPHHLKITQPSLDETEVQVKINFCWGYIFPY